MLVINQDSRFLDILCVLIALLQRVHEKTPPPLSVMVWYSKYFHH